MTFLKLTALKDGQPIALNSQYILSATPGKTGGTRLYMGFAPGEKRAAQIVYVNESFADVCASLGV